MNFYDKFDKWEYYEEGENFGDDYYYPDEFYEPNEEEERRIEQEEYEHNHGVCSTCGGEWGDGWTTCTCTDGGENELL